MSIMDAKLSSRDNTCLHAPSTGCGPDVCNIRTSYVSRQCTSFDGDNVAPCLLRRLATPYLLKRLAAPYLLRILATPYLLRRLAAPYLLRRLAAPYLLRRLVTPYLLRRHYSLVITSGPKVAFVTPAIPVDRFDMEWFYLRNIRS
ncbi:hypothetical protein Tco_1072607 [Tanacetum coccineum]